MTTSQIENDTYTSLDKQHDNEQITELCVSAATEFQRITKNFALFNALFSALCVVEVIFILFFFAFLTQTSILAVSLAVFFLTLFSYFVMKIYFNTKKPEQLLSLRSEFIQTCKDRIHYQEGVSEHHLAIANAACKFATTLKDSEYHVHTIPKNLEALTSLITKVSCWMHWKDVHKMRELLLLAAIEEHIAFIKFEPINLEAHASLASVYVLLSSLYSDPRKSTDYDSSLWLPPKRFSQEMQDKFIASAERAMEEFNILNDYAPDDPWVHTQLAYSYRDLQMPLEEIKEYETILKISPGDNEILFKLGLLYFEQGFNARGLQVYEELKRVHYKKAEALIHFYGSY